jgi:telomerase reverse transcriptase
VYTSTRPSFCFDPWLTIQIVDFVIWLLFKRSKKNGGFKGYGGFPDNVICHGFQRGQKPPLWDAGIEMTGVKPNALPTCTIPGLYTARNPQNAQTLKEAPWPQLLAILGASAEKIMTDLLLDCSLFLPVETGDGNYVQLTGKPLFNAIPDANMNGPHPRTDEAVTKPRQPSDITFSRTRMFYTNTCLTKTGNVHFGLNNKSKLLPICSGCFLSSKLTKMKMS